MGNSLEEIVIPTIIMIALFILNFVVLFAIYRYRQRMPPETFEEELRTFPASQEKDATT